MTAPLSAHGHWHLPVDERRSRQLGDELRERVADRREELEQLAERRDRVVRRQEGREHVPAAGRTCEDHALIGRGARQLGQRRRRAHDLEAAADDLLDLARRRDRDDDLAAPVALVEELQVEEQ